VTGRAIALYWFDGAPNLGDALSPSLAARLSGKPVISYRDLWHLPGVRIYSSIGSILQREVTPRIIVWGSGFMTADSRMCRQPAAVRAVRGPLTRLLLLQQGIDCPEVYGDPALFAPRFWPKSAADGDILVVPHFFDKNTSFLDDLADRMGGRVVDVQGDVHQLISTISAAKLVVSSSLHGLILAVAYQRPVVWVEFSENIPGGRFKFRDFFLSIGCTDAMPVVVRSASETAQVLDAVRTIPLSIDLETMLKACPFLSTPEAS
jgi:pyruvyltransferase